MFGFDGKRWNVLCITRCIKLCSQKKELIYGLCVDLCYWFKFVRKRFLEYRFEDVFVNCNKCTWISRIRWIKRTVTQRRKILRFKLVCLMWYLSLELLIIDTMGYFSLWVPWGRGSGFHPTIWTLFSKKLETFDFA